MFTSNTVEIRGKAARSIGRIYRLAADIQDWPTLLPHYQCMRILEQSDTYKVADFGAAREFGIGGLRIRFPCRWRARQELFPNELRITFKHLKGITRGMWVEWRLEDCGDHVRVTIDHELTYPVPILGPFFAQFIVGNIFVHNVASKTLNCIKAKVESETL